MHNVYVLTFVQCMVSWAAFTLVSILLTTWFKPATDTDKILQFLIAMTFSLVVSIGLGASVIYHAIRSQRR